MSRLFVPAIACALAACVTEPAEPALTAATQAIDGAGALVTDVTRTRLDGDVYHHAFTLRLGDGPNARIRLHRVVRERAPWLPRATRGGVVFFHGDFASFGANFAPATIDPAATPGLAPWLAARGFDVWGVDRRWALPGADDDVSDLGEQGFAQEIDDAGRALVVARAVRLATGSGGDRLHVAGFSRGGFLAYAVAAADGARPPILRSVKGLVPLDVWAVIPPEDVAAREGACLSAFFERADLAAGVVDSPNGFFIDVGRLASSAPDAITPYAGFLGEISNLDAMRFVAGQTYAFFAPTPHYHLAAGDVQDGVIAALTESPEDVIATWFAQASPHQSLREAADTDGIWCADGQGPPAPDLRAIRVPLFYLGARGGYGDRGVYSTTLVGSSDVTVRVVGRGGDPFEDFGHGDLLFADDAPHLAWQPLAHWLAAH